MGVLAVGTAGTCLVLRDQNRKDAPGVPSSFVAEGQDGVFRAAKVTRSIYASFAKRTTTSE